MPGQPWLRMWRRYMLMMPVHGTDQEKSQAIVGHISQSLTAHHAAATHLHRCNIMHV